MNKEPKMITGNRANSKAIKEVISANKNAKISIKIPQHNAGVYNMLGLRIQSMTGTKVKLQHKVFCIGVGDWDARQEATQKASYFGWAELHILHDPTVASTDQKAAIKELQSKNSKISAKAVATEVGLTRNAAEKNMQAE